MHIGISRPPTPAYPIPDVDLAVVAANAESLGFESVFYGEHPIRPVDQLGIGVHAHGIPFFQDTLVGLSRASAVTSTINLGGAVFLIPQHNPVQFAKELATLDHYSGGRLLVGAGIGWSQVECEALGGHWNRRWEQTLESIKIMKLLWSQETVEYRGEFYNIPPVQLFPQPASKPWPPVLLSATGSRRSFERIIEVGDGWIPHFATEERVMEAVEHLTAGRSLLHKMAEEAGRDPASLQITAIVRGPQVDGDMGPGLYGVSKDLMRRLADTGIDRALISLPTIIDEESTIAALERIAELVF